MKKFQKIICIFLFLTCLFLSGCGNETSHVELQELGTKTIEVTILDVDNYFTLGFPRKNIVNLLLENKEYNIKEWYNDTTFGNMDMPNGWDYQEGKTIKAEINYYYYPSNGKIVKAWIQEIY